MIGPRPLRVLRYVEVAKWRFEGPDPKHMRPDGQHRVLVYRAMVPVIAVARILSVVDARGFTPAGLWLERRGILSTRGRAAVGKP